MSNTISIKKYWKNIGVSNQKYNRQTNRSPSYQKISLPHSKQRKYTPSQNCSTNVFRAQQKQQLNNEYSKFCQGVKKQNVKSGSVVQKDNVKDKQKQMSKSGIKIEQKDDLQINNRSQLQLLELIFKNKQSIGKKQNSLLLAFYQKLKKVKINWKQLQQIIQDQIYDYKAQLIIIQSTIQKLITGLIQKYYTCIQKNKKLQSENCQIRKQLLNTYDIIQKLSPKNKCQSRNQIRKLQQKKAQILTQSSQQHTRIDDYQFNTFQQTRKRINTIFQDSQHYINTYISNNSNKHTRFQSNNQTNQKYKKYDQKLEKDISVKLFEQKKDQVVNKQRFKRLTPNRRKKSQILFLNNQQSPQFYKQLYNNQIKFKKGFYNCIQSQNKKLVSQNLAISVEKFYKKQTFKNSLNSSTSIQNKSVTENTLKQVKK